MTLLVRMTVPEPIQFDGRPCRFAKEIEIVNAFRMLAAEFVMAETAVAQPAPKEFFRPGFVLRRCRARWISAMSANVRSGAAK